MVDFDPVLVLGLVVWVSVVLITLGSIWTVGRRTQRRIDAMEVRAFSKVDSLASRYEAKLDALMTEARPTFDALRASVERIPPALDTLANLEAVPATIVMGLKPVLHEFMETEARPLAQRMMDGVTSQFNDALGRIESMALKFAPLASTGARLLGESGNVVKADKKAGREATESLLQEIIPLKGMQTFVKKHAPPSAMEDPLELLGWMAKAKAQLSAFNPVIGQMIDGAIAQRIGSLTSDDTSPEGVANIFPAFSGGAPVVPKESSYMTP